jgi:hypothetical protein
MSRIFAKRPFRPSFERRQSVMIPDPGFTQADLPARRSAGSRSSSPPAGPPRFLARRVDPAVARSKHR